MCPLCLILPFKKKQLCSSSFYFLSHGRRVLPSLLPVLRRGPTHNASVVILSPSYPWALAQRLLTACDAPFISPFPAFILSLSPSLARPVCGVKVSEGKISICNLYWFGPDRQHGPSILLLFFPVFVLPSLFGLPTLRLHLRGFCFLPLPLIDLLYGCVCLKCDSFPGVLTAVLSLGIDGPLTLK